MAKGRKTGGRRPGSLNKDNADIRAMVLGALSDVGGQAYLAECAIQNPSSFLMLVAKVMPTQLVGNNENPVALSFQWAAAAATAAHTVIEHSVDADVDTPVIEANEPEEPLQIQQPQRAARKR